MYSGGSSQGVKVTAVILILATAAAASRGLGPAAPPGPRGAAADSEALEAVLSAAASTPGRASEIPVLSATLSTSARMEGLSAGESFARSFPPSQSVLAMLALDRDVDDFREAGEGEGLSAAHYRRAAAEAERLRPLRDNYTALYAAAWGELVADRSGGGLSARDTTVARNTTVARDTTVATAALKASDLAPRAELEPPPRRDLAYSHPYALDIFFTKVEKRGEAERGPAIGALEGGIVVAAAGDWRGGAGLDSYRGGGLSPSSGNGVVIYSPGSGRYYSYFHFYEVSVRRGDVVAAGSILGRGGNTGVNARKPDHGGHLHLEIFDMKRGIALSSYEIRDLLFR
jgi:murein DD-endopeptidase MepM/ murein hydrolase activator NlpD